MSGFQKGDWVVWTVTAHWEDNERRGKVLEFFPRGHLLIDAVDIGLIKEWREIILSPEEGNLHKIEVGDGYRFLELGEKARAGDQSFQWKAWHKVNVSFSGDWSFYIVRRPI